MQEVCRRLEFARHFESRGLSYLSDSDKTRCLNYLFTSCFNKSVPSLNPIPLAPSLPCSSSFLCSEGDVISLISHLPSKTASGHDGISSWMLISTSFPLLIVSATYSTSLSLLVLFHLNEKPVLSSLSPSLLLQLIRLLTIYRPISLLSLVSKLLKKHIHTLLYYFCTSYFSLLVWFSSLPLHRFCSPLLYSHHLHRRSARSGGTASAVPIFPRRDHAYKSSPRPP